MAKIYENNEKIWHKSLDDVMSESFGRYAKYIIQDRALPDIRDGLKPVQRRILFAMNELKINFDKPYKKSARTVGEVIGKYHPHGDSSIYEAMVRMSQEWKNNLPLLDMQGNKGSIDGDPPAAMRYTECRLSRYGQILLDDIEKETVKFIPNFDDSESEPSILPSLLPNILINGATGIAAGYATNIPPFNFNEVLTGVIYRISHKHCLLEDIVKIIKGPDFPTGCTIQGKDEILKMYQTGRGKINIRATFEEITKNSNKKSKQLIVTEIPFEVNKSSLVKALDELRIDNKLPGLKEVRDDSDKNGISIVLDLDTEKDLEIIKNFLYKNTQLQISYPANMVVIKDRKPCLLGILDILDEYVVHANNIIIKSSEFDLNKFLLRKEILEGLIKVISSLDQLIKLIRSSNNKEEAKEKLINHFNLSERQAEAVVQLRLYVLTSYDTQKLKNEYDELLLAIKGKEDLINNPTVRNKFLIDKLTKHKEMFGNKRLSNIEDEIEDIQIEQTDIIEEKNGIAITTRDNYIKFVLNAEIDDIDLDKIKIKESDIPIDIFKLSTLDNLICITNKGKIVSIPAYKIKTSKLKENGIHINELITIDSYDRTIASFSISKYSDTNTEIIIATKQGLIKRIKLEDVNFSKNAKVLSCINLKNDDEVVSSFVVQTDFEQIIIVTETGFAIRYNINEIPLVGRTASGVKNITLKPKDFVIASFPLDPNENFIFIGSNRGAKRIHFQDINLLTRGKIGRRILIQVDSNPYVMNSAFMISGRQVLNILGKNGQIVTLKASEIPISDPSTRMSSYPFNYEVDKVSLVKLDKNIILINENNNFDNLKKELELTSKILIDSKKTKNNDDVSIDNLDEKTDIVNLENINISENTSNDNNDLFDNLETIDEKENNINELIKAQNGNEEISLDTQINEEKNIELTNSNESIQEDIEIINSNNLIEENIEEINSNEIVEKEISNVDNDEKNNDEEISLDESSVKEDEQISLDETINDENTHDNLHNNKEQIDFKNLLQEEKSVLNNDKNIHEEKINYLENEYETHDVEENIGPILNNFAQDKDFDIFENSNDLNNEKEETNVKDNIEDIIDLIDEYENISLERNKKIEIDNNHEKDFDRNLLKEKDSKFIEDSKDIDDDFDISKIIDEIEEE